MKNFRQFNTKKAHRKLRVWSGLLFHLKIHAFCSCLWTTWFIRSFKKRFYKQKIFVFGYI